LLTDGTVYQITLRLQEWSTEVKISKDVVLHGQLMSTNPRGRTLGFGPTTGTVSGATAPGKLPGKIPELDLVMNRTVHLLGKLTSVISSDNLLCQFLIVCHRLEELSALLNMTKLSG